MITHVKFVSIPTTDQDRSLEFYTEHLGFRIVTDQASGSGQQWIELRIANSDTRFVLFTMPDGPRPGFQFNGAWPATTSRRRTRSFAAGA